MRQEPKNNLVGLMIGQNPNWLVGMLGILKAGRAIVPIDPNLPKERIQFLIDDCGIQLLVTEQAFLEKAQLLAEQTPGLKRIICVDRADNKPALDGRTVADYDDEQSRVEIDRNIGAEADQSCYVIYTSGSTGKPKAVSISHRNLSYMLDWSRQYFGLGEH